MSYTPSVHKNNGVGCITNDLNASISVGPDGIFLQTGLISGPAYTGKLAYDGFSTTNPNGIEFQSALNMNGQNIDHVDNLNATTINGNPVGGAQNLAQVLATGNAANSSIDMTNSDIFNVNNIVSSYTLSLASNNEGEINVLASNMLNLETTNGAVNLTSNGGGDVNILSNNILNLASTNNSTYLEGAGLYLTSNTGGSMNFDAQSGYYILSNIPTSSGGPTGSLYNAGGVLMIN